MLRKRVSNIVCLDRESYNRKIIEAQAWELKRLLCDGHGWRKGEKLLAR